MQLEVRVQGKRPNRTWFVMLLVKDNQYNIGLQYPEVKNGEYACVKTVNNMTDAIAKDLDIDVVSLAKLTHMVLRTYTMEILPDDVQEAVKLWQKPNSRNGQYYSWHVGGPNGGNEGHELMNEHFRDTGAQDDDSVLIRY